MSTWNYLTRKQHREENKIPEWVPIGDDDPDFKRLWMEDDSRPPDGEHGYEAWLRIFGEHKPENQFAKEKWDGGDHDAYLFPGNRVYISAYDGTSIWQYMPPRKFA
jgi:hypothetical protein